MYGVPGLFYILYALTPAVSVYRKMEVLILILTICLCLSSLIPPTAEYSVPPRRYSTLPCRSHSVSVHYI